MHTEKIKGGSFLSFFTMATGIKLDNSWKLKDKSNSIHNQREETVTTHVYGSMIEKDNRLKSQLIF